MELNTIGMILMFFLFIAFIVVAIVTIAVNKNKTKEDAPSAPNYSQQYYSPYYSIPEPESIISTSEENPTQTTVPTIRLFPIVIGAYKGQNTILGQDDNMPLGTTVMTVSANYNYSVVSPIKHYQEYNNLVYNKSYFDTFDDSFFSSAKITGLNGLVFDMGDMDLSTLPNSNDLIDFSDKAWEQDIIVGIKISGNAPNVNITRNIDLTSKVQIFIDMIYGDELLIPNYMNILNIVNLVAIVPDLHSFDIVKEKHPNVNQYQLWNTHSTYVNPAYPTNPIIKYKDTAIPAPIGANVYITDIDLLDATIPLNIRDVAAAIISPQQGQIFKDNGFGGIVMTNNHIANVTVMHDLDMLCGVYVDNLNINDIIGSEFDFAIIKNTVDGTYMQISTTAAEGIVLKTIVASMPTTSQLPGKGAEILVEAYGISHYSFMSNDPYNVFQNFQEPILGVKYIWDGISYSYVNTIPNQNYNIVNMVATNSFNIPDKPNTDYTFNTLMIDNGLLTSTDVADTIIADITTIKSKGYDQISFEYISTPNSENYRKIYVATRNAGLTLALHTNNSALLSDLENYQYASIAFYDMIDGLDTDPNEIQNANIYDALASHKFLGIVTNEDALIYKSTWGTFSLVEFLTNP